jgi:hypothetical protein
LRVTMIRTMPHAITAMDAVCTDRFHKFRGVRNAPPDRTSKPIQMTANAPSMPTSRGSTSSSRSLAVMPGIRGSVAGGNATRRHALANRCLG